MTSFRVGGDFFSPSVGRYVGRFTGIADGPQQTYPAADGKPERKGNTIRWFFDLYNLDGTPVVDPKKPGEVAVVEGLSSDTVGMGRGTPAKARVWLTKMLESKGLQFTEPQSGDDVQRMVESVKGVYVYLSFGPKKQGPGTVLSEMERMQQPTNAPTPVAAPIPAAPAAPLPVPAATPFVPTDTTTSIPAMPFPVAS